MIVRQIDMDDLVMSGRIPMATVDEIRRIRRTPSGGFDLKDSVKFTPLVNAVIMAAAVDPRITPQKTDRSMGLEEFSYNDKLLIFVEANQMATAELTEFPGLTEPGEDA